MIEDIDLYKEYIADTLDDCIKQNKIKFVLKVITILLNEGMKVKKA